MKNDKDILVVKDDFIISDIFKKNVHISVFLNQILKKNMIYKLYDDKSVLVKEYDDFSHLKCLKIKK